MHGLMSRLRSADGQVLAISALSLSVLLGFAALAVDTGVLFRAKRKMQTAADAAAIAGTMDHLYKADANSAKTTAQTVSSSNGYTDGTDGAHVYVYTPPNDGPNAGNTNFTEAIVQQPASTFFMSFFGKSTVTVGARAVAGVPNAGQACIWLMATSGTALSLQGSYNVQTIGCGIYVNSPSSNALNVTGGAGVLNAKFLDVVGSATGNHTTNPTAPTVNAATRTNPFGNITGPTSTGQCTSVVTTSNLTLSGQIAGPGAGNTVCYTQPVTLSGVTMGSGSVTTNTTTGKSQLTTSTPAGTFVFMNGVSVSGSVTVYGGTIDVEAGSFNQGSNTNVSISAPTSGTYNGIALMQPSTNSSNLQVQFGSNNQILDGYIYAPGAAIGLHDSGGGVTSSGIVALSMSNQTSQLTIPSYDAAHPSTTPNRVVALVE
jgi:hypothetical protein